MSADGLKYFDTIERYVEGNMTDTECEIFEQNLSSDELLKKEYTLYLHLVDGIEEHYTAKYKNQLRAIDLEMDQESVNKTATRRIILFSIAATFVVLLVSYSVIATLFNQPDLKEIASKYDEVDKGIPVLMSMNDDPQFSEAMNQYKLKDYKRSLAILQHLNQENNENDTLIYYIGINYQMLNNWELAIPNFEKIAHSQNSIFKDKAEFKSAICYLKLENKKQALIILKNISRNSQHLFQKKAAKIVEEIERE